MGGGASILYPEVEEYHTCGRSAPQSNEDVATSAEHRGNSSCGAYGAGTDTIGTPSSGYSSEPRLQITGEEEYNQGFFVFLQLLQLYEDHRYYYPPGKFSPDEEYANNYSLYGQLLERAMLTSPLVKKHEEVLQSLEYYSQEWGKEKAEKEQIRLEFESLKAKVIGPLQRLKSVEEELQHTKAEYFRVQLEKTEAQEKLRFAEEVAAMQVEDIRAACIRREMIIYEETSTALKSKDDSIRDLEKGFEDLANGMRTSYESKIATLKAKVTEEQDKVHRKTFWDQRMLVHTEDGSLDNIDIACILCCSQLVLVDECIDTEKLRSFGYHWLLLQVPLVSQSFFPVYSALMALNVLFKFSEILQDVIENGSCSRDLVSRPSVHGGENEENVVMRPPSSHPWPSLERPQLSTLAALFSLCEPSSGHALSNKTLRVYLSNLLALIACHPTPRSAWSSGESGIQAITYLLSSSQSSLENCVAMMATRNICFDSPMNQLCLAQSREAVEAVIRACKQEIDEESLFMTGVAATNMLYRCPQAISSFVSHNVPGTLLHRLQVNLLHFSPRVVCSLFGVVISIAFQKNLRQSIAATWAKWLVKLLRNARKNVTTVVEAHNEVLCNDFHGSDSGAAAFHEASIKTSEARSEGLVKGAVRREHDEKAYEGSILERKDEESSHTSENAHESYFFRATKPSQAVAEDCTVKDPSGSEIVVEEIVASPSPVEETETDGQSFDRELDENQEARKTCAAKILQPYMIPGEILAGVCRLISVLVFESMDNTELFLELGILDCLTNVLKRCGSKRSRGLPSSKSTSQDCSHTKEDSSGSTNEEQGSGNENTPEGTRHNRGDDQALISACGLLSILSLNEKARKYLITSTICTPLIRLYYGTKYSSAVRTAAILALSCLSPTRKEKHYWDQNAVSHDFFVSGAVRVFLEIATQHSEFLKRYPTVEETVMELCPDYLPWKSQSAKEMDGQVESFLISDSSSESLEVENEVLKKYLDRQKRDNPKIPRKDGILEVKLSEEMATLTFMFQDYDNRKDRKTKKDFINIDALSMSIPAGMEFDVMNRSCSEGSTHKLLRRKRQEGGYRDPDSSKSLWTWSKWWWE